MISLTQNKPFFTVIFNFYEADKMDLEKIRIRSI